MVRSATLPAGSGNALNSVAKAALRKESTHQKTSYLRIERRNLRMRPLIAGGAIAVVYIAARFVGKSLGVLCLAHLSGIRPGSGGLLSLALLPTSGIALAMTSSAGSLYPAFDAKLATIVLAAALILELVGPLAVQFALRRAGETRQEKAI